MVELNGITRNEAKNNPFIMEKMYQLNIKMPENWTVARKLANWGE